MALRRGAVAGTVDPTTSSLRQVSPVDPSYLAGGHPTSACGRQLVDWSADYRLFSKDKWELNSLFRPVIRGGLSLEPHPIRLVVAIDDTLLHKSSRKTPGVSYDVIPWVPLFKPT